jgi:hypothetical protein
MPEVCFDVSRGAPGRRLAGLAALVLASVAPATAQAQPPVRLSVSTAGGQADGPSGALAMTLDGRTVLFVSTASNLVPGDSNGADTPDLFVRDRDTDRDGVLDEPDAVRTVRVTEGIAGEQLVGGLAATGAKLSPDGRFVIFTTRGALVAGDTNGVDDIYLRDRDADGDGIFDEAGAVTLTRVSVGAGGGEANGPSGSPELSATGRYVVFSSEATNLTGGPAGERRWLRKDLVTGDVVPATSTPTGARPATERQGVRLSPNGRYVVFAGGFSVQNPSGTSASWFLRDFEANTLTAIFHDGTSMAVPTDAGGQASARGAATAPLTAGSNSAELGFSPDSRTVFLESTLYLALVPYFNESGTVHEFDIASGRFLQSFAGLIGRGSVGPARVDTAAGAVLFYTYDYGNGACPFFSVTSSGSLARYDATTRRVTLLVNGLVRGATASPGARLVTYSMGPCDGPVTTYLLDSAFGTPLPLDTGLPFGLFDGDARTVVYGTDTAAIPADTNGVSDVYAAAVASFLDRDSDALDDRWEVATGLDYTSAAGDDGPGGDPDGDGRTNLQEQAAGTHPRGTGRQFLAEGAQNAFFSTRIAIANPTNEAGHAVVRFDGDDGSARSTYVHVPAGARRTVRVDEIGGTSPSFATTVEADAALVTERTMTWDTSGYGGHAERASAAPASTWFLAEGATGEFGLFYLLQNPNDVAAVATIRYLRPAPAPPLVRDYTLPPRSRTTLPINAIAELAATDVSASITATQPILVERAMYRTVGTQAFAAGHASAGVTAAATSWFLAEGATGPFFDLFILLANPSADAATVEVRYLLDSGTVHTKSYVVAANSRRTIYVDAEEFPGVGRVLDNVNVSSAITVTNGVPIVVERAMWFPGPSVSPAYWSEAHNSAGATSTATRWALADGEVGGSRDAQTYVLVANTSPTAGRVRVTILPETPSTVTSLPYMLFFDVAAHSRTTISMKDTFFQWSPRRFGVLVESVEPEPGAPVAQIVVERAMYWNSGGEVWAAGTNVLATPLP